MTRKKILKAWKINDKEYTGIPNKFKPFEHSGGFFFYSLGWKLSEVSTKVKKNFHSRCKEKEIMGYHPFKKKVF